MKSHQYASKRWLTNICCLIVSLGFIKLIFSAYVMAGGELFEFTSEKQERSSRIAMMAREEEQKAVDKRTQDTLQLAANKLANQDSPELTENKIASPNTSVTSALGNNAITSNSRVSFFPKGQNADATKTLNASVQNNGKSQVAKQMTNPTINQVASQENTQGLQTSLVPVQTPVQGSAQGFGMSAPTSLATPAPTLAATLSPTLKPLKVFTKEDSQIDRSDRISSDAILARASSVTANIARKEVRASLLQNAFKNNLKDNSKALDGIEKQASNYKNKNAQVATQTSKPKEKASFFSFVGTAHAAEEPYIRPDENLNIPIPVPTVAPYDSPESLEYQQSELNRKEEELIALQQQMNARMEELNALEGRIGTMVQGANTLQDDKFKHLIDTYTSMKAKRAAEALTTLDEDIAVRILNGMRAKQSGEIFSYMDPIQAARLSEAMTQLRL